MTTVVLVHGAWHGSWVWDAVRRELGPGVDVATVDLPQDGCRHDVEALTEVLDRIDGDVILCGHSYGAQVISLAALGRDDVIGLIYISGFVPGVAPVPPGRATFARGAIRTTEDGRVEVIPEMGIGALYADCPPELAADALARLRPVVADATEYFGDLADDLPIDRIYSAYAVCADDQTFHPEDQRTVATRADVVVEWPTSHSPMLSQPKLVAALIRDVYETVG